MTVIGANSYIARNLLFCLGKSQVAYSVKLYDKDKNHADADVRYEQIDILDKAAVSNIDMQCDTIFMFTGKTGTANGFDDYDLFIDINEKALLNVLDEYRRQKSKAKIIFPSTRLVYKGVQGKLKENAEKEFKTVYAINKYSCEKYLEQYYNMFGVQYCIFRICVPYGTLVSGASSYGTAEFMLSKATANNNITLYGDGSIRRTLTYIGDLCNILLKGASYNKFINDVYNIGGEDYSLKEMATVIANVFGVGIDYIPWTSVAEKIESGDTVFDDAKLQSVLPTEYTTKFAEWCKTKVL